MGDAGIASFCEITGTDPGTAQHFIEACNGDVHQAIQAFYEDAPGGRGGARPGGERPHVMPHPLPGRVPGQHGHIPGATTRPWPPPGPVGPPSGGGGVSTPFLPPSGSGGGGGGSSGGGIDDIFKRAEGAQDFQSRGAKVKTVKLVFWRDGFQVDGGPFRALADPGNQEFVSAVSRGEVPRELYSPGVELDVHLEDHREEAYRAPQSHMLGPEKPKPAAAERPKMQALTVDCSTGGPTTRVRMNFPDGQMATVTVSLSATLDDLAVWAKRVRPDLATHALQLFAGIPAQRLMGSATVESAGLKMAQIQVVG